MASAGGTAVLAVEAVSRTQCPCSGDRPVAEAAAAVSVAHPEVVLEANSRVDSAAAGSVVNLTVARLVAVAVGSAVCRRAPVSTR